MASVPNEEVSFPRLAQAKTGHLTQCDLHHHPSRQELARHMSNSVLASHMSLLTRHMSNSGLCNSRTCQAMILPCTLYLHICTCQAHVQLCTDQALVHARRCTPRLHLASQCTLELARHMSVRARHKSTPTPRTLPKPPRHTPACRRPCCLPFNPRLRSPRETHLRHGEERENNEERENAF